MGDAPRNWFMENGHAGGISTLLTWLLIIGGEGRISSPVAENFFPRERIPGWRMIIVPILLATLFPGSTPLWYPPPNRLSLSWY